MDNIGMFSDVYPACPFPKSFSYQINKIGDSDKKGSLADSAEDIKMFDSPDRNTEDFEKSLKKTMECIAQVCDTTVPERTPLKSAHPPSPVKSPDITLEKPPDTSPSSKSPSQQNVARPHPTQTHRPTSNKKFSTHLHHPYSRNSMQHRNGAQPQNGAQPLNSVQTQNGVQARYATESLPPYSDSTNIDSRNPHSRFVDARYPHSRHTPQQPSKPEHFIFPECTPDLQKEFFMFYMQKCMQQQNREPPPYSALGTSGLSGAEIMSGKNISRHLEERRFVDSTTSPINPGYMGGSTTSPLNPGYMGGSTTSPINPGYMGDSTTSPLNPGFLENKENKAPTDGRCQDNVHFQDSCKFVSSPPNGTTDPEHELKPEKVHFNFPSSATPSSPHAPVTTPIMGPSMDATLAPSPSFFPPQSSAGYIIPSSYSSHTSHSTFSHPASLSPHSTPPEPSNLSSSSSQEMSSDNSTEKESLSATRPTMQYEVAEQATRISGNSPPNCSAIVTSFDKIPSPGDNSSRLLRPPNLPTHLFPDTSSIQLQNPPRSFPPAQVSPMFQTIPPQNRPDLQMRPKSTCLPPNRLHCDPTDRNKAIPDNLAATYIPSPEYFNKQPVQQPFNKPYVPTGDFFSNSSHKEKFSFKDTLGKMLSKKPAGDSPHPTKRTKFTAEQVRILEHFYQSVNKYVTGANKGTLCQVTGLELSTILMWFQNKRAREKKLRTSC